MRAPTRAGIWSAEALMLVSEVTEAPSFNETSIVELIEGATDKVTLKFLWNWLKCGGDGANTPQSFFEKLGFGAKKLTAAEKANLNILLGKFVRPKLAQLEAEKAEMTRRIEALGNLIEMTGEIGGKN